MKLQIILKDSQIQNIQDSSLWRQNPEINNLEYDSRQVRKGNLFFAIKGFVTDGKKFLADAFARGAVAALVDSLEGVDPEYRDKCLVVSDPRWELAGASTIFFGYPSRSIKLFGITGTNGKTSCTHLLASILEAAGHRVALMGTVERTFPGRSEQSDHTTQESLQIQKFLREAVDAGVTAAVVEVSSHALSLHRVVGCEFDGVLFNNLDLDHQDFYKTMEAYYAAKRILFIDFNRAPSTKKNHGVINGDDEYGKRLLKEAKIPALSFGLGETAQISGKDLHVAGSEIVGQLKIKNGVSIPIKSQLAGTKFNYYNITAAAALAYVGGIDPRAITLGIQKLSSVPGRLNRVPTKLSFTVYVDYAHSGTGLYSVLQALREICRARLIVVFGAGGNKDPLRRVKMGEAAAKFADISVVTSDNPRFEEPGKIIEAIVRSWNDFVGSQQLQRHLVVEEDRLNAIRKALQLARENDIVCIAGKGHEQGQIVGNQVLPFNDFQVATQELRKLEECMQ